VSKTAFKLFLTLLGLVTLVIGAYVHNRFLYSKATTEPIYKSPINLQSPHTKQAIKQSSYISLDKLKSVMEAKNDPMSNPDAIFMEKFPRQELYPIVQEVPTLPKSLSRYESKLPAISRLHFLLYKDLTCTSFECNAQKYAVIFPYLIILIGAGYFILEHRKTFTKRKVVKIIILAFSSSAFVLLVFFVASLMVVIQLQNQTISDIKQAVSGLNDHRDKDSSNDSLHTTRDSISVFLTVSKRAPILYEPHNKQEILALYLFPEEKNVTFYEKYILLNSIVEKDYLSELLKPNMYLFDETKLVVYKYDKNDLEILMPILSKNIIQTEFQQFNPKVNKVIDFRVLDQVEYQEFQEKKEEELKAEINKYISIAQGEINKVTQAINESKNYLNDIENYMDEIDDLYNEHVKEPQEEYDKYCKGGYENYPECIQLKNIIEINKKRLKDAERTLEQEKEKINEFEQDAEKAEQELNAQLAELYGVLQLVNDNPVNTEYQKGVFFPGEMGIKLRYFDPYSEDLFQERISEKESKSISEQTKLAYDYILSGYSKEPTFSQYLMTSLHEYLHAVAYYENYAWPDSLEESMTEYLSLEAGYNYVYDKSKLDRIVYADNVRMLEKLLAQVDSEKIIELYFNDKTDRPLRNEFARVYSNYNFDTFKNDFDSLLYMNYDDIDTRKSFIEKMSAQLTLTTTQ
jgi:hypothetical protein